MPASSASSSDDDDEDQLAALRACAVSFEDISRQQQQIAAQAKKRLKGKRDRQHVASAAENGGGSDRDEGGGDGEAGGGDAAAITSWRDAYSGQPNGALDAVQRKIAAALDALLEQRIAHKKVKKAKHLKREDAGAQPADGGPVGAADGQESDPGGFRFFRRVPRGAAVVLERPDDPGLLHAGEGTPFPALFRERRQPHPDAVKAALPALAVDGSQLLQQAGRRPSSATASGSSARGKLRCSGIVLEGRPFVPHEERMRKLLAPGPVT